MRATDNMCVEDVQRVDQLLKFLIPIDVYLHEYTFDFHVLCKHF